MDSNQRTHDSLVNAYALPPAEIERRSLGYVDASLGNDWIGGDREIVKRMAYAAGDLALASLARIHPEALPAGLRAISLRQPIVCDVSMVAAGIRQSDCPVHVAVAHPEAAARSGNSRLPRSVEGMRALQKELDGSIAVIGNAPTALLALLDMVDAGTCRPALIIGTPVGFVAAAESKQELVRRGIPYVTVTGTRGGSAIAAAAMNALLLLAASTHD
ncbi:MAG: precorrin-8X methylmutase [Chloroflexota bacterium]|nr:precorrin-8X methylmutase [Chloroflexota bacterium]